LGVVHGRVPGSARRLVHGEALVALSQDSRARLGVVTRFEGHWWARSVAGSYLLFVGRTGSEVGTTPGTRLRRRGRCEPASES
jgi:hypothetical protein